MFLEGLIDGQCIGGVAVIVVECGRGEDDGYVLCMVGREDTSISIAII